MRGHVGPRASPAAAGRPRWALALVAALAAVAIGTGLVPDLRVGEGAPARLTAAHMLLVLALSEPGRSLAVVRALADLGVTVSIDDFGTGWSSLTYLRVAAAG